MALFVYNFLHLDLKIKEYKFNNNWIKEKITIIIRSKYKKSKQKSKNS